MRPVPGADALDSPPVRRVSLLLVLAALSASACGARALVAQGVACGDTLIARGDTAGAAAACEAAVQRDKRDAESHYRAGQLLQGTDKGRAEEHFRTAIHLQPDSGKYWLALADLLRTQDNVFARTQVAGLVENARAAAREYGSEKVAEIEYRSARIAWERYEQLANRYLFIEDAVAVDASVIMGEWKDVEDFFRRQVRPDPGDPGAEDRGEAEQYLRAALAADPRRVDAAGLLAVLLGEEHRWDEAVELGRRLVRAVPDSGNAWAVLGLALTRTLRWRDARAAFDTAMQRMTPAERTPYGNLGPLLKSVDQARFAGMSPAQQAQLDSLYWAVSQPLLLATVNEVQIEFSARLTYVMHRWADPFRGVQGYETDRGAVYLRYGPPDIWAAFGRGRQSQRDALEILEGERNTIVWVYHPVQLRFMFSMTPGFARTNFSGDFRAFYNEQRDLFPVRFDNVPTVADMDTILVQFGQFRGDGATTTELGVFSVVPIGHMASGAGVQELPLTTAAIIRDGRMREVRRDGRQETVQTGDSLQVERRSFRFELAPAEYLLRVEAQLAGVDRAARSTSLLALRTYGPDSLMMSDVVVANSVAPRDSSYSRWTDFFIQPSAGRFAPNAPVALLWEIYNLSPDSTGRARYAVELRITVRDIERKGFAARILGGIGDAVGLSARGDDEVSLAYDREVTTPEGGRQVEYLTVDLEDAPVATYVITLRVTDKRTQRVVEARRQIAVTAAMQTPR
jgi:GWxTD domain-containing protein